EAANAPVSRRSTKAEYAPYYQRLSALATIADVPSDPTTQETLRGHMVFRGTTLPLTFERSVYNTIASEWAFGVATVQALVDPASIVATPAPAPEPVVTEPVPEPAIEPTEPSPTEGGEAPAPS